MEKVQVYEFARTVHLERIVSSGNHTELLYRKKSYDFDEKLALRVAARQLSRWQIARALFNQRPEIVELNEPMMLVAWPSLLLYTSAIWLTRRFKRSGGVVVSYAISNEDIPSAISSVLHTPHFISRFISRFICKYLLTHYDRIAFGTPGSIASYKSTAGELPAKLESRLFLDLDKPCSICPVASRGEEVIFLGSFEKRKGVLELLDAWPYVVARLPSARLKLVGKGILLSNVEDWVRKNPSATLVVDPPRSVIHSSLNSARVLVLLSQPMPRWREQVGLPILEGLSHGCEIVASSQTGIAEWLLETGHRVVDPKSSSQEIARQIVDAIEGAREPHVIQDSLPPEDTRMLASDWLWSKP